MTALEARNKFLRITNKVISISMLTSNEEVIKEAMELRKIILLLQNQIRTVEKTKSVCKRDKYTF